MSEQTPTSQSLDARDLLAAGIAAACVLAGCWARHRFEVAVAPTAMPGAGEMSIADAAAAVAALLFMLAHPLMSPTRERALGALTVGIILAGLIAVGGLSGRDAMGALGISAAMYLAGRCSGMIRSGLITVAGAAPLACVALAAAMLAPAASTAASTQPAYPTLWRDAEAVLVISLPAWLLTGLALSVQSGRHSTAVVPVVGAALACIAAWFLIPAEVTDFPLTLSAAPLLAIPAGWAALRAMSRPGVPMGIRRLGVVLLVTMPIWFWPGAAGLARVLWVAVFPP